MRATNAGFPGSLSSWPITLIDTIAEVANRSRPPDRIPDAASGVANHDKILGIADLSPLTMTWEYLPGPGSCLGVCWGSTKGRPASVDWGCGI